MLNEVEQAFTQTLHKHLLMGKILCQAASNDTSGSFSTDNDVVILESISCLENGSSTGCWEVGAYSGLAKSRYPDGKG